MTWLAFVMFVAVVAADGLEAEVARWTGLLLENAPLSLAATKQMMLRGLDQASLEAAFAGSYPAHDRMLASEDAREGPRAFAEKRRPVWKGR